MYTHNLNPVLFDFGIIAIRWYSLAYIFGIILGWWLGKKIIARILQNRESKFSLLDFDELITYLIISIIIGGRFGYVIFYNLSYYISNPFEILRIWEGGMSFHGALIGVIIGTHLFANKKNIQTFILLDVIACVSPLGIFLGRIANFINGELVGKITSVPWGVIFPAIDEFQRHPSQIYEALLEGLILFFILNILLFKPKYNIGRSSALFLILYGVFRVISELFREPDKQIGYLFNLFSMGTLLSVLMIIGGFMIIINLRKKNEIKY